MGNGQATYSLAQKRYFIDIAITGLDHNAPDTWKNTFEYLSQMLFEATLGQMQLGKLYWLSEGSLNQIDDVFLGNTTGGSVTSGADPDTPFMGFISLTLPAKTEPLIILHELGHYMFCLAEEYNLQTDPIRRCSNNPATHRSIMEFARGHGVVLNADGFLAAKQPGESKIVSQFCYKDHPDDPRNFQQQRHGKSCWGTMVDLYPKMKLPPGLPENKIVPVTWVQRTNAKQYSLAILGSDSFAQPKAMIAIKNAAKAWADFVGGNQHQLALFSDSPNHGIIRPMGALTPGEKVSGFAKAIDKLDFRPAGKDTNLMTTLKSFGFEPEESLGAYLHLIMLAPGNYHENLSPLIELLAEYRVQLIATTYGSGQFADQLSAASESSRWIDYRGIPAKPDDPEAFAFSLQNSWVENYFLNTGGSQFVELYRSKLPAMGGRTKLFSNEKDRPLNVEIQNVGLDLPVLIEENARAANFILSEFEGGCIELTLVAPDGTQLTRESEIVQTSMDGRNVSWIKISNKEMKLGGRWIVRLRRVKHDHELPFQMMVTVDAKLFMTASSEVKGKRVRFSTQTSAGKPLDFVESVVDVYQTHSDEDHKNKIHRSIRLEREKSVEPGGTEPVEVSTGNFQGEMTLEPGSYAAIFRTSNNGRAVYATNKTGVPNGNTGEHGFDPIPAFTRTLKTHFVIK